MRLALAVALALSAGIAQAAELVRVRGVIENVTDTSVTVKTKDGKTQQLALKPDTAFVSVVKSSLDKIGEHKFIGTATKGDNPPTALEVVIFPDDMKGTGEGHYPWDEIADTTAGATNKILTPSAMTNGTVQPEKPTTTTSMTNATVKSGSATGEGKTIDVTYNDGQSKTILVPPTAPIVAFEKADKSILAIGAPLFAVTAPEGEAYNGKLVAVGKDGVVPPM